ncbi:hypothetical protein [Pseudochrobactrum asaccharolyticum]|uniref:DUF3606 domain-containing protein n=1 Tax=Pseudochrobactrum asaccharolyticum TaxID=354351 RepID=A0A366DEM9_9HYPH|nr:hypothetical protein [Pseudochrobactrum asaccharolyticum]RBO88517.1 hypothetical protein DFR47_11918 [Pseudochrobactrum asaccharolyticum]
MTKNQDTTPLTHDKDIKFLAENTDISPLQAQELIQKFGRNREVLLKEALKFKAEG